MNKITPFIFMFFLISCQEFDSYHNIEFSNKFREGIYLQFPAREKINDSLMNLDYEFVDTNNSTRDNALFHKGRLIFENEYPIFPTYINDKYLVIKTGLNSFDWGGLEYFFKRKYTRIIVLELNTNRITLDKKIDKMVGRCLIEDNKLIFIYGSEEDPKAGYVNI